MIWKRKEEITKGDLGPLLSKDTSPPKKKFEDMLDILLEAERYDNIGEEELSNEQLAILKRYIIIYEKVEKLDVIENCKHNYVERTFICEPKMYCGKCGDIKPIR